MRLLEILIVAAVYFTTAKIGQTLAIPPGNVTPVWIPSGIILAVVLIRGYYIWPGIFLGAFLGNVWAYIDPTSLSNILSCFFTGTASSRRPQWNSNLQGTDGYVGVFGRCS